MLNTGGILIVCGRDLGKGYNSKLDSHAN